MASLSLRILGADRAPLRDSVDVDITLLRTNESKVRIRDHAATKRLKIKDLTAGETYVVRVFPVRHRPVGRFVMAPSGEQAEEIEVFCPVHPQRVGQVIFPNYDALDVALRGVLERSTLERDDNLPPIPPPADGRTPGQIVYDSLTRIERAGLLNVYCKMSRTPLGDVTTWAYVTDVYRVRGDRIFVNVQKQFRDRVKNAVAGSGFKEADDSLHTPGPGFARAGSFKTRDHYGNLQLSFFSSIDEPLRFRVDADIDDAGGIGHVFQVLDHFLTGGETHPFDIHQILTFHQRFDVGYELIV